MQTTSKSQVLFYLEIVKLIPKFILNTQNSENNLDKDKRGLKLTHLKTYYKTPIMKTSWYIHKNRYLDHWNGFEISEINSYIYDELIF